MAGQTLSASIVLNAGGVKKGVDEADSQFGRLGTSAGTLSKTVDEKTASMGSRFTNLGNSLGMFGVPFTGALTGIGASLDEAEAHTSKFAKAASSLHGPLDGAGKDLEGASSKASGFAGSLTGILPPQAEVAVAVAAGAGVIIASSVDAAEKYQQATASIASSAGISTGAAKKIGDAFLTTAGQTTFSGQEIATAFAGAAGQVKLLNGGTINAAASMTVMKAAMDLAEGSGTSLSAATSDMTSTLQAFGLGVQSSPLVANVLFNAARDTGQSVDSMGSAIDKARAKMGAVAPPVQQMAGLLVDLTQHGETGRAAMTALGSAFNGIVAPTAAVTKAQQAMGLSFIDAKGQLEPMDQIIGQIAPKIAGMGDAQGIATLKAIGFGSADSKLLTTIQAGPAAYDKAAASVAKTGSAADAAAKQGSTMEGSWKKITSALDDARVSLGEKLMPVVTMLAQKLAAFAAGVAKDWPQISEGFKVAWAVAKPVIDGFIERVKGMWNIVSGVVSLIEDIFHGRWGKIWGDLSKIVKGELQNLDGMLLGLPDRLLHLLESLGGKLAGLFTSAFGSALSAVGSGFSTLFNFFTQIPSKILSALSSLGSALGGLFTRAWQSVTGALDTAWSVTAGFFTGIPAKILGALATLGSSLGSLFTKAWGQVTDALNSGWSTVANFFTGLWNKITGAIGDIGGHFYGFMHTGFERVKDAFVDGWNDVGAWVSGIWGYFTTAVGDLGGKMYSFALDAFGRIKGAFLDGWNDLSTWVEQIPQSIVQALGDVTTLLESAGKAIIDSLGSGIRKAFDDVKSFVSGIGHTIASLKGPLDYDATLLIPHGNALMAGLGVGIQQGFNTKVRPALAGITNSLATTSFAPPGATPFAGGTSVPGLVAGPGARPVAAASSAPPTIIVYLTVQGSVMTDKQLTDTVRQGLLQLSLVNGSSGQIPIVSNSGT